MIYQQLKQKILSDFYVKAHWDIKSLLQKGPGQEAAKFFNTQHNNSESFEFIKKRIKDIIEIEKKCAILFYKLQWENPILLSSLAL